MDLSLASPQGQYRTVLYDQWVKQLVTQNVPHTSEPTFIGTLGNPVKIRSWQVPMGELERLAGPVVWYKLGQEPLASFTLFPLSAQRCHT